MRFLDRSKYIDRERGPSQAPNTPKAPESFTSKPLSRASAFFKKSSMTVRKDAKPPQDLNITKKSVKFGLESPQESHVSGTITAPEKANDQLVQIKSLCHSIQQCLKIALYTDYCLGYLACPGPQTFGVHPKQSSVHGLDKRTSLGDLLMKSTNLLSCTSSNASGLRLSRADRLELALTISSNVLQLNGTPWFQSHLTKNDILLLPHKGLKPEERASIIAALSPTKATDAFDPKAFLGVPRSETLFSLSILLTELCLAQSFESLRSEEDPLDGNGNPNILTDMSTVTRLLEDVYRGAGNRYGDAVRRCIHCDFNQRKTDLQDDAFRQAVYEGVVVPLQEVLQDYREP